MSKAALLLLLLFVSVGFSTIFSDVPLFSETTEEDWNKLINEAIKWRTSHREETQAPLNPLILIPGLTGSNLNVKLTNAKSPFLCPKNQDWNLLWCAVGELSRPDCFFYNLGQTYDPNTQTYANNAGVEIEVVDFGGVDGVEYIGYLAGLPVADMEYMAPLITSLESAGYVVGQNLAAAPYDWRRTANPNGWNARIQNLIETYYTQNQNTPVWVLAHSMGNLEFTSFLNTMSSEWKDQYVAGFLSVAGPWSGASFALRALISGLKIGLIDPLRVARDIRSFGSIVWMLPDAYIGDEPLVVLDDYTSYNYATIPQLLTAIGATTSLDIYNDVGTEVENMPNPNVPMYCIYGVNVETELWYEYRDGFNAQPTTIHYEIAGDGVVPLQSLKKCLSFNPVENKEFNLLGHSDLIKDPAFFTYIMQIVNP